MTKKEIVYKTLSPLVDESYKAIKECRDTTQKYSIANRSLREYLFYELATQFVRFYLLQIKISNEEIDAFTHEVLAFTDDYLAKQKEF